MGSRAFELLAAPEGPELVAILQNPASPRIDLSFGFGVHFCLGAQIARQELRYCLKPMVQYLKDFNVSENAAAKWSRQLFMRTIESVSIAKQETAAHV